ncbi:uncharacterized protein LOC143210220 [Lasioglossum baleicum]|uniref:uncharacterized protein LOC143210220 n=1 Tax=Lasioglossum baleicum TaxID=434251 RepID=UPI003FCC7E8D
MADENEMRHHIHFLNIKRDTFEKQIKKFLTWLDESPNLDRSELCRRRDRLQKQFHRFDDDQTARQLYENDLTVTDENYKIIEQQYYVAITKADSILEDLEQPINGLVVLPGPSTSAMNDNPLKATFNGNYKDWPKFKKDFQRFLDANSGLSERLKLQKLRSCLPERMKVVIESYCIGNADDFKLAWEMLETAYENTYKFTMHHASRVFDTPAMPDDSMESIQRFIRHIDRHMRCLEIATESWADIARILLLSLVITKMGPETRRRYEQALKDQETHDINDFLKHLGNILQSSTNNSKPSNDEKPETGPQKRTMDSSSSMYRSRPTSPPPKRLRYMPETCHFCNKQSHILSYCETLKDMPPIARRAAIRKAELCEICLRQNHSTKLCYSNTRCKYCKEKHNTFLHVFRDHNSHITYYEKRM